LCRDASSLAWRADPFGERMHRGVELAVDTAVAFAERSRDGDVDRARMHFQRSPVVVGDRDERQAQGRAVDELLVRGVDDPAGGWFADDRAEAEAPVAFAEVLAV